MSRFKGSDQPPQKEETAAEEGTPAGDTSGAASSGAAPDGAALDGAASDGATPDGSSLDGADPNRAAPDGVGPDDIAPDAAVAVAAGRWYRRPAVARAASRVTTVLAALLVLFALLLPNQLTRLTPGAFVRIPVEGILVAAVLLVRQPVARRVMAVLAGVALGLVTLLNVLDLGFYSVLDRPFDLVLDWILFDDAESFLRDLFGPVGATAAVIGVGVLVFALLVLMALAVVRLSRLMVRHSVATTRTTLVLGTVWVTCMALGVQIAGVPVASRSAAELVNSHVNLVSAGLKDERVFAEEASVDAFRDTPPDQLLTALRGKDVIFAFIESYGRSAVEDPAMAPQVGAVLDDGTRRLKAAGYSSRSGFLTSPVAGAGSWLAHSTFLSGMWIKNQQRYRSVTSSDRLTLTSAFRSTGDWRTVGIMPGVTRSWPEGKFFGLDHIYDSRDIGYQGPKFSWSPVPDQYSLAAFERLEHGKPGHEPLMTEIVLASSHNPWAPIPRMIGWDEVGDGSVYHAIKKAGKDPKEVWKDPENVRTEYRRAIEYSLNSLVSYVENYGDDNTVLVVLGDHQPNATVTGTGAGRDVPISIVAHDPAVLDRISDWGWQDGLKPGPQAPVWQMDSFRDRFLTAYGPKPGPKPRSEAAPKSGQKPGQKSGQKADSKSGPAPSRSASTP
ncbi:sulfatase [Streptomyces sp. NPDC088116]|uniref:sulfatase n=1 Tax=Streptomyces sp. NPDC088116 TaxID=3365825 RepID=UPI00380D49B8